MKPTPRVRMSFLKPGSEFLFVPTPAFLVQPKGWIQRLCWRLLRRGKAVSTYCRQDALIRETVIDPDQLARQVIENAREQFKICRGMPNPQRVLLGRKQFAELMGDPSIARELIPRQLIRSSVQVVSPEAMYTRGRGVEPFLVLGLDIEVIPHMDGILVL